MDDLDGFVADAENRRDDDLIEAIDELRRLRRLRESVLAHQMSPAVPHGPAWDDQLETVYKAAEDAR